MEETYDTPVLECMKRHRSIRVYESTPLPDGMLEAIIRSAQMASSSSNLQQYSVVEVTDPARKDRLADLSGDQEHIRQCPVLLVFCCDLHRLKLVCKREGKQIQTGYVESFITSTVDVALFSQNVALAAESLGLGIVYIGGIRNHPEQVVAELELPDLVFPLTGMCLGYPAEEPRAIPRLPLPAILHRETYQDDKIYDYLDAYDKEIVRSEVYRSAKTGELYGWSSRAARRMAYDTPDKLRIEIGQVLRRQGFGLR